MTKKKRLSIYYIIFLIICLGLSGGEVMAEEETEEVVQKTLVGEHCTTIMEELKKVQKTDARARVYLGGFYEKVLTDFVVPFNMRLVENSLSTAGLVENQNKLAEAKALFASDFIVYQQGLEELVAFDCKNEPQAFYEKLEVVRRKRKIVEQDTMKVRSLMSEHVKLANQLKGKL